MCSSRIAGIVVLLLVLATSQTAVAATPEVLAYVGEDTLTTLDLRIELNLMSHANEEVESWDLPEPEAALRRLIQNRLIIQEGYRMGLDQEMAVRNPVDEAVNNRCISALLDSVAAAVPRETDDLYGAQRRTVQRYIDDLMVKYNVVVDTLVLNSLDYGSSDPEVEKRLRESKEILVVAPTGSLSVAAFSRIVRFKAFHGLVDKPDAAQRRDRILRQWVEEVVILHEARQLEIRKRPSFQLYETRLERTLMLEETLKVLLNIPFEPTDERVAAFYAENIDQFMGPAMVRMESLKFDSEDAAMAARERLQQGTKLNWIERNMDGVIDGPAPFPFEFFDIGKLNLKPEEAVVGWIPAPYGVPGGWVLARVTDVQEPSPRPLAECRNELLRLMKAEDTRNHMSDIVTRLEEAVEVSVQPGAVEAVSRILDAAEAVPKNE